jgi:hypothetical protein
MNNCAQLTTIGQSLDKHHHCHTGMTPGHAHKSSRGLPIDQAG